MVFNTFERWTLWAAPLRDCLACWWGQRAYFICLKTKPQKTGLIDWTWMFKKQFLHHQHFSLLAPKFIFFHRGMVNDSEKFFCSLRDAGGRERRNKKFSFFSSLNLYLCDRFGYGNEALFLLVQCFMRRLFKKRF